MNFEGILKNKFWICKNIKAEYWLFSSFYDDISNVCMQKNVQQNILKDIQNISKNGFEKRPAVSSLCFPHHHHSMGMGIFLESMRFMPFVHMLIWSWLNIYVSWLNSHLSSPAAFSLPPPACDGMCSVPSLFDSPEHLIHLSPLFLCSSFMFHLIYYEWSVQFKSVTNVRCRFCGCLFGALSLAQESCHKNTFFILSFALFVCVLFFAQYIIRIKGCLTFPLI